MTTGAALRLAARPASRRRYGSGSCRRPPPPPALLRRPGRRAAGRAGAGGALGAVLHLDKSLAAICDAYGAATYAVLFAIVFAETGLVVTPFLPGDSLLFAAGTLAALGALSLPALLASLFVAAVLGDTVNYAAGKWLGGKVFTPTSKVFKPEYLEKTEAYYAKYGAKTVVLARFLPIVRTFAPFVAGVGSMPYGRFVFYNIAGAAIWVGLFCCVGYFFGTLPFVQKNFAAVVLGIVAVSVVPVAVEVLQARRERAQEPPQPPAAPAT